MAKMMHKFIIFSLLCTAVMAYSHSPYYFSKTADMDFLVKQKKIYNLFFYIEQSVISDAEFYEIGHKYDIFSSIDYYTNKEAVTYFLNWYKVSPLRKDALFTYYNQEHREEMVLLYRLFYFAKDFITFYKTACWARVYLNPGLFYAAFSTAVIYRDDTKYIRLPPIYEIYPNLFFDSKVIFDAYRLKMTHGYNYQSYDIESKHSDNSVANYYVYSNFTNYYSYPDYEYDYKLSYFMEDVSVNAFYYYFRMAYPFWINSKEYSFPKNFRGDFYYFFHKQLMARYYLERFSNGLGGIEDFSWDKVNLPGFYSDLSYYNGVSLPRRDFWYYVPSYKFHYFEYIKQLETRIFEAIDSGFFYDESGKQISFYSPEGLNYLGNIIEGNYDSYNLKYYGAYDALARDILGMSFDTKNKDYYVPSSLQFFSTSMRDPAFYRIYDKILYFFQRYKSYLPRYTKDELDFPGVKFENVEVDRIVTYFDHTDYLINNAVAVDSFKEGFSFNIKAWQYTLNYKPFTYKFSVSSDKDTKAVVRIFLGPTFEGDKFSDYSYLLHYYQYFFMLDEFEFNLKTGLNNFDRHTSEAFFFENGHHTSDVFYKKVIKAIEGNEPFTYSDKMFGFPNHMMFPKGSVDGMRFKMFFYIGPVYEGAKVFEIPTFGHFNFYGQSFGFPLDRPMYPWFFELNNLYFKDAFIYHRQDYEYKYNRQY